MHISGLNALVYSDNASNQRVAGLHLHDSTLQLVAVSVYTILNTDRSDAKKMNKICFRYIDVYRLRVV